MKTPTKKSAPAAGDDRDANKLTYWHADSNDTDRTHKVNSRAIATRLHRALSEADPADIYAPCVHCEGVGCWWCSYSGREPEPKRAFLRQLATISSAAPAAGGEQ